MSASDRLLEKAREYELNSCAMLERAEAGDVGAQKSVIPFAVVAIVLREVALALEGAVDEERDAA